MAAWDKWGELACLLHTDSGGGRPRARLRCYVRRGIMSHKAVAGSPTSPWQTAQP